VRDKIEYDIMEWAQNVVNNSHKSGFYGINVVEKILRDPGMTTSSSGHKVLWWPKNKRIAAMSRAMHLLDPISVACLIVAYGKIIKPDGNLFTKHDLAKISKISVRKFNELTKKAKNDLRRILLIPK